MDASQAENTIRECNTCASIGVSKVPSRREDLQSVGTDAFRWGYIIH